MRENPHTLILPTKYDVSLFFIVFFAIKETKDYKMWPFVPHAVFLTVSNSLEHKKPLEHAVTAPFCYFIQNLKNNILITDSFVENCH